MHSHFCFPSVEVLTHTCKWWSHGPFLWRRAIIHPDRITTLSAFSGCVCMCSEHISATQTSTICCTYATLPPQSRSTSRWVGFSRKKRKGRLTDVAHYWARFGFSTLRPTWLPRGGQSGITVGAWEWVHSPATKKKNP